jgi:hypothetical protein
MSMLDFTTLPKGIQNEFTESISLLPLRLGDEWWHELTYEGESSTQKITLPAIIVKKGEPPSLYPDWDE